MENSSFIEKIDSEIKKHHLLNHSFYKAWNEGALEKETIKEYAAQYFQHVSLFPRYLSAIHSNCDDINVRQLLLENLIDEDKGKENHPELWMRFAEGMGNSREEVKTKVAMNETKELVETFMKLSRSEKYHIGLAALYCYESMQPEISETKKEGLKEFYGVNDENTLKFFTVHMHADKWHRAVVRKMLIELSETKEQRTEILEAVKSSLGVLNNFLTGMEKAYS
jgi:pyrroloquinoline-quinone synthase